MKRKSLWNIWKKNFHPCTINLKKWKLNQYFYILRQFLELSLMQWISWKINEKTILQFSTKTDTDFLIIWKYCRNILQKTLKYASIYYNFKFCGLLRKPKLYGVSTCFLLFSINKGIINHEKCYRMREKRAEDLHDRA